VIAMRRFICHSRISDVDDDSITEFSEGKEYVGESIGDTVIFISDKGREVSFYESEIEINFEEMGNKDE
jgi:hypothetical protein